MLGKQAEDLSGSCLSPPISLLLLGGTESEPDGGTYVEADNTALSATVSPVLGGLDTLL